MDAFDADVLIYAAQTGHPLGTRVRALFSVEPETLAGIGSILLLPEVLSHPLRHGSTEEIEALMSLLGRLDLRPVNRVTAEVATTLAADHGLRAADAVHLASAVVAGADRFITNDRRDLPTSITEIDVTYPEHLDAGTPPR